MKQDSRVLLGSKGLRPILSLFYCVFHFLFYSSYVQLLHPSSSFYLNSRHRRRLLRTCPTGLALHSRAIYLLPSNNLLRSLHQLHGRRAPIELQLLRTTYTNILTYPYSCFLITLFRSNTLKRKKRVQRSYKRKDVDNKVVTQDT